MPTMTAAISGFNCGLGSPMKANGLMIVGSPMTATLGLPMILRLIE